MQSKKRFLIAAGFLVTSAALLGSAPANAQSVSVGGTFRGPHGVISFGSGNRGGYYGGGYRHAYVRPYVRPYVGYVADDYDVVSYDDDAYCAPPLVTYRTYRAPRYVSYFSSGYGPSYRYGGYDRYRHYSREDRSYGRYGRRDSVRYERGYSRR